SGALRSAQSTTQPARRTHRGSASRGRGAASASYIPTLVDGRIQPADDRGLHVAGAPAGGDMVRFARRALSAAALCGLLTLGSTTALGQAPAPAGAEAG